MLAQYLIGYHHCRLLNMLFTMAGGMGGGLGGGDPAAMMNEQFLRMMGMQGNAGDCTRFIYFSFT